MLGARFSVLGLILVAAISTWVLACQKTEQVPISPKTNSSIEFRDASPTTKDADLVMLSKAYAKAQQNQFFRNFVERQVKKQVSGENSVMYFMVRDSIVHSGKTFSQILKNESANTGNLLSAGYFQDSLLSHMPMLAFTVYTGTSDNEVNVGLFSNSFKTLPWTDKMIDTKTEKFESGFSDNLSTTTFSNRNEPAEPVTIVEETPVFILIDQNLKTPQQQDVFLALQLINECSILRQVLQSMANVIATTTSATIDNSVIGRAYNYKNQYMAVNVNAITSVYNTSCQPESMMGEPCEANGGCERDGWSEMEEITQIKVVESELKTFCHWIRSHCKIEIRPTVTGQINQTSVVLAIESELQFFITAKRKDLKNNKTYAGSPLPLPMFRWKYCTGDHGDPYLITAIGKHINAGTEKSLTINFTPTVKFSFLGGEATLQTLGLSRTVKHTVKDTPLGTFAVNYCDTDLGGPWSSVGGHGYTTGTFTAWIRERH